MTSHDQAVAKLNFDEIATTMRRTGVQWGSFPNAHSPTVVEIETFVRRQLVRYDVVHRGYKNYLRTNAGFTFERERMDTGGWWYKVEYIG